MLVNWQRYFQPHILERGIDYFNKNRVVLLEKEEDCLSAEVIGSETYEVEIIFEQENVIGLECTCPHAADNHFCKHMAAVMFAYDMEKIKSLNSKQTQSVSVIEVVNQAEESVIRQFLIDVLANNKQLLNQFIASQKTTITPIDLNDYKRELQDIFDDHLYPNDFIAYNEAWDFQYDLEYFMTQTIENTLIQNGHFEVAFQLINTIILELIDLPIDDSGGTIIDIVYECTHLWEVIFENGSKDFQGEMFAWFTKTIELKELDFLEDYLVEFLFHHFTEENYMNGKIQLAKTQLENFEMEEGSWSSRYEFNKWALYYLQILELFDNRREEQQAFILENLESKAVRGYYVDQLIASEQFNHAIDLIEEARTSENESDYLSQQYDEKLKDLYLKTGKEQDYKTILFELVCQNGSHRMDIFEEYKQLFQPEEWVVKRETLLDKISAWAGKDKLLFKEGMEEELLQLALDTPGLEMIQKYEEIFYQIDSEKVLTKYEEEVLKRAEFTTNRKTYRMIAQMIRQMKNIPKSKLAVENLLRYLKETYKNRPAMLDELSHL